ncbi:cobyrinate a,c-diamide synthase [Candidatus Nitrosocosmicus arcticus]|uniref:Cobyrinate a,c-diamide synthase n=1 Tax=Candidatus Nitrosocosmicus arcticus TaxID=2035267 RepID=A0A557SSS1_9ARCH|nr:cobyrinate a,c-diamide synthase [Candidatus Nitrosocosmicus arcticus]TVP39653.1 cobyrinic acid a,c-diamide synthase [Candidatus Nitrosocosmicus arcticus]
MMKTPGIVIAGITSGVGKTTISIAIMQGLLKRGYKVQPFKIGPDFIDPSYHNIISKRRSRNLDVWLMGINGLQESYLENSVDSDFTVLEGVMGLYDGMTGKNNFASTAHVSKILDLPILLVVDAKKAARSLAAITLGFIKFEHKSRISGVILNNIASERHLRYITEAFESKIKIPIVGKIFNDKTLIYHERHLGLIPGLELNAKLQNSIIKNSNIIAEHLDFEKIIQIGRKINYLDGSKIEKFSLDLVNRKSRYQSSEKLLDSKVKISVALDKSFNFYYQDNLDMLHKKAKIEFFSPLDDRCVSEDTTGIILGGGFPEIIADKLEKNSNMRKSILDLAEKDIPIYAECGGLMYLTKTISGYKNSKKKHKMVGLFDADTIMTNKVTLGYTEALLNNNETYLGKIRKVRGHEFHYSTVVINNTDLELIYNLKKGRGIKDGKDGFHTHNSIASYMHTHFINSTFSDRFLKYCVQYSRK